MVKYKLICHIAQQYLRHYDNWIMYSQTGFCSHKRHPIPRPHGRTMVCLFVSITEENWLCYNSTTQYFAHTTAISKVEHRSAFQPSLKHLRAQPQLLWVIWRKLCYNGTWLYVYIATMKWSAKSKFNRINSQPQTPTPKTRHFPHGRTFIATPGGMGQIFCVEFQRVPLKFHTKYLTHTLKNVYFIHRWKFKSS